MMPRQTVTYLNDALLRAVENGDTDVAKSLIILGADVHTRLEAALRHAVEHNDKGTAKMLVAYGADVEKALWSAATLKQSVIISHLYEMFPEHKLINTFTLASKIYSVKDVKPVNLSSHMQCIP